MILHTVNKSPHTTRAMASCLEFSRQEDGIVLLEDGVYAAVAGASSTLAERPRVYAIRADVLARGLSGRLTDAVEVIDYAGFVKLCVEFPVVKNWS